MQFDVETLHGLTSVHSLKSVEQGESIRQPVRSIFFNITFELFIETMLHQQDK